MRLTFFAIDPNEVDLRPADSPREWMDNTPQRFAYRCLPLNISNAHGWCFHLKSDVTLTWNGERGQGAVSIESSDPNIGHHCLSVFGDGIVTFHVSGVFRTEPDWNILASGPFNTPKDGIYPLTGVIETDWSPYSFTMNWQITRKNHPIHFKKGEPFCMVFPVKRGQLEEFEPEIRSIHDDPKLLKDHTTWGESRSNFNEDLLNPEGLAAQEKWQKAYFKGRMPDDSQGCPNHQTKIRLKEFKKGEPRHEGVTVLNPKPSDE
jgi:hypothetical protein